MKNLIRAKGFIPRRLRRGMLILNFVDFRRKIFTIFMILGLLANFCHAKSKRPQAPYFIDGKIDSQADNSEICSVELIFHNKSEKKVAEYTAVFFLFDEDGEVYSNAKNNFSLTVEQEILPDEIFECSICLDEFFYEDCDDFLTLDYLYVSKIKYADGSIWQDPFGLAAF